MSNHELRRLEAVLALTLAVVAVGALGIRNLVNEHARTREDLSVLRDEVQDLERGVALSSELRERLLGAGVSAHEEQSRADDDPPR